MELSWTNYFGKYGDGLVRVVAGLIFLIAGIGKLMNGTGKTAGFFSSLGIPLPEVAAVLVIVVEIVGGLMLILGLYTWIAASLLSIVMIVAILLVHIQNGWSDVRYPLLLLLVTMKNIAQPTCSLARYFKK